MSLNVPLQVLAVTSRGAFRITKDVRDVWFRSTSPGGFASVSISLDRPLKIAPDDLMYFGRLVIADGRTGEVVCEGRIEDLGRGSGTDGEVWEVTAMGPAAHVNDRTLPLIYIDRSIDRWVRSPASKQYVETNVNSEVEASPGFRIQLFRASVVPTGDHGGWEYRAIRDASQKLALLGYEYDMGVTATDHRLRTYVDGGGTTQIVDLGFNIAGSTLARVVITDFVNGRNLIRVAYTRNTSSITIADDVTWLMIANPYVRAILYSASGTERTTGYTGAAYVTASEVVNDLLGRVLTQFDGASASVASTSYQIQQLAYPDGVAPRKVLEDLLLLEPSYTWHAWERQANGKYRFEWVAWPSTVRYEADVKDGFDSPGSASGVYDRVTVRYLDNTKAVKTTTRTQAVTELTSAGIVRQGFVDLGDEVGSATDADRAGDKWLVEHSTPPNSGRLTVARPIMDFQTGRVVQPWEIKPGNLIRVRGVLPRVDALNSTRDGVTIFRIVSVEYRAQDAAAVLELDSYSRSVTQGLASAWQGTSPTFQRPR